MRQLFSVNAHEAHSLLKVPPFQRRYCWRKPQIEQYLADITPLCSTPLSGSASRRGASPSAAHVIAGLGAHSMGRVLVTRRLEDGHLNVVDGQQRCTTTCLFLSALRDFLLAHAADTSDVTLGASAEEVVHDINAALFPLQGQRPGQRGEECVLRPTYFDRASFDRCVRPSSGARIRLPQAEEEEDHVLKVRAQFDDVLYGEQYLEHVRHKLFGSSCEVGSRLADVVGSLAQATLDKMCVLLFVAAEPASETQAMYARLAVREKAITSFSHNRAPGMHLDEVDMCRNVILCVFSNGTEQEQESVFERYWLPIELLAKLKAADTARCDADAGMGKKKKKKKESVSDFLSAMLLAFVEDETERRTSEVTAHVAKLPVGVDPTEVVYGLYSRLRECIEQEIAKADVAGANANMVRQCEQENVLAFLERFLAFGRAHWREVDPGLHSSQLVASKAAKACWCELMGSKCTDCIVKKAALKR